MKRSDNPSIADLVRVVMRSIDPKKKILLADGRLVVDQMLQEIAVQVLVHGHTIRLPGFGSFFRSTTKTRAVGDLHTGERRQLPATFRLGFRAAKARKGHL